VEVLNLTNELPNNLTVDIPKFLVEQQEMIDKLTVNIPSIAANALVEQQRLLNNLKQNIPSVATMMAEQAKALERIIVDIPSIAARALMEQQKLVNNLKQNFPVIASTILSKQIETINLLQEIKINIPDAVSKILSENMKVSEVYTVDSFVEEFPEISEEMEQRLEKEFHPVEAFNYIYYNILYQTIKMRNLLSSEQFQSNINFLIESISLFSALITIAGWAMPADNPQPIINIYNKSDNVDIQVDTESKIEVNIHIENKEN